MTNIKEKIDILTQELKDYNYNYYILNESKITDYNFDLKLKELQELEIQYPQYAHNDSPTKKVGGDITKQFNVIKHDYPMLSLSNTYSIEEILEFEKRIRKLSLQNEIEYTCELKYDGVAISIQYIDGEFHRAVTRGDGEKGEDVTNNVRTIKSLPLKLKGDFPKKIEVRGEIILTKENFRKLNVQRFNENQTLYANPRNTAAGSLKLQDSSIVAQRNLDCMLYDLYGSEDIENHFDRIRQLYNWGFRKIEKTMFIKTKKIDEIEEFINYWDKEKKNLNFEIDGIVIKVNNKNMQETLGYTSKIPRWAIAFKFPSHKVATRLLSVDYQVGRTGAITPVANLEPVLLGGTMVKRASIHNEEIIKKLDLFEDDEVFIEKGGEIIPKIVGVNTEKRKNNAIKINFIKHCPSCNSQLHKIGDDIAYYCLNTLECKDQQIEKIKHFASKNCMNIDGLGGETIDLLYNNNLIKSFSDLYDLKIENLLNLERLGEKSAEKLINSIYQSKNIEFENVIFALGIRYVGKTIAKFLANEFENIDNIINANLEQLENTNEIGKKIANSVYYYFQNENNIIIIDKLKKNNINFEINKKEILSNKLEDRNIIISGTFVDIGREDLKKLIELNGGKNVSSISKNTDLFIIGDNVGPAKKQKAEKLNIKMISYQDLILLLK